MRRLEIKSARWPEQYKRSPIFDFRIISKMSSEGATSTIKVEIDHFLFYRKSRVGVIIGTLIEPLLSNGTTFVRAGEDCKIKFKFDCMDFTKLSSVSFLELVIRNSCEEKMFKGGLVKQFTAERVSKYIPEQSKTMNF